MIEAKNIKISKHKKIVKSKKKNLPFPCTDKRTGVGEVGYREFNVIESRWWTGFVNMNSFVE